MGAASRIAVVKIGGNVINSDEALARFLADFARLSGPKILVHGGGKAATRLAAQLGIPTRMVDGRRITDPQTLDVVTMVYAGLINKRIVAGLQRHGCNALGLSGADGNLLPARRRPPESVDFGCVGDILQERVNAPLLRVLLDAGITPVFCAITHDGEGSLLNSNADSVASAVAAAAATLGPAELHLCFEKEGVLRDIDDPASLIALLTPESYAPLRAEGAIHSGMIPKIDNAFRALALGVGSVVIQHADNLLNGRGTRIEGGTAC